MLNKKELGLAIKEAIELKIASGAISSKADVARAFKVKPPSVEGWISRGTISKSKIDKLFEYFSDVVGPEHWGLKARPLWGNQNQKQATAEIGDRSPTELNPRQQALLRLFEGLTDSQKDALIRELQEKKQQNDELLTELLKRKAT